MGRFMTTGPAVRQPVAPPNPGRVQQAIARLKALPAFYPTVQKALRLMDDPLSSDFQVQQVINTDQAVAARVLQLANSAFFGFYSRVTTVSLALTLIGRERVGTLLRRFLVEEMLLMLSGRKPAALRIRELSVVTATAAHSMAERLLRDDKEEILLAGLLHNIGELVLLSQFRDQYGEMTRLRDQVSQAAAEKAVFGVESPVVGRWLLEAWNFPDFFVATVEHWPDPWAVHFPHAPVAAIALVHVARWMAECWLERRATDEVYRSFEPRLLSTLEVDRDFLVDQYERLPDQVQQLRTTLA